jgi:hypothetical protein
MRTCLALGHFADRRFPPLRINVNLARCNPVGRPLTIWAGNTLFLDYCSLGFFICIGTKTQELGISEISQLRFLLKERHTLFRPLSSCQLLSITNRCLTCPLLHPLFLSRNPWYNIIEWIFNDPYGFNLWRTIYRQFIQTLEWVRRKFRPRHTTQVVRCHRVLLIINNCV